MWISSKSHLNFMDFRNSHNIPLSCFFFFHFYVLYLEKGLLTSYTVCQKISCLLFRRSNIFLPLNCNLLHKIFCLYIEVLHLVSWKMTLYLLCGKLWCKKTKKTERPIYVGNKLRTFLLSFKAASAVIFSSCDMANVTRLYCFGSKFLLHKFLEIS